MRDLLNNIKSHNCHKVKQDINAKKKKKINKKNKKKTVTTKFFLEIVLMLLKYTLLMQLQQKNIHAYKIYMLMQSATEESTE